MQKTTLIFDFDGTIADSLPLVHELYDKIGPRYGALPLPKGSRCSFTNIPPQELMKKYKVRPWTLPLIVRSIIKEMKHRSNEVPMHNKVVEEIKQLADQKHRLFILTSNSSNNATTLLEQHGIDKCFKKVISYKALFGKHRALKKMIKKYKIDPSNVMYIGDEIRDIQGAQKAGVKIAAVAWGYQDESALQDAKPDMLIMNPEELGNL